MSSVELYDLGASLSPDDLGVLIAGLMDRRNGAGRRRFVVEAWGEKSGSLAERLDLPAISYPATLSIAEVSPRSA